MSYKINYILPIVIIIYTHYVICSVVFKVFTLKAEFSRRQSGISRRQADLSRRQAELSRRQVELSR